MQNENEGIEVFDENSYYVSVVTATALQCFISIFNGSERDQLFKVRWYEKLFSCHHLTSVYLENFNQTIISVKSSAI